MSPLAPVAATGRVTLAVLAAVGAVAIFAARAVSHLVRPPFYPREFLQQLVQIGWLSLPVVGLTAVFNAETVVPSIVAIGITRELGPVLGGLMVAARVASSIAAEIGTMKVTEQIDALVTLSTNPLKYLAVPRLLAATLAVPALVAVGDAIGIAGGWIVSVNRLGFNSAAYLQNTADFLETWDVVSGLVKGAVFGFLVALMGCFHGMNSGRGAQGVGRATKAAVVGASVAILAANYILTELFFSA
jgi:phospholipid/cholesterol/gamma-HCH transport system permease protein